MSRFNHDDQATVPVVVSEPPLDLWAEWRRLVADGWLPSVSQHTLGASCRIYAGPQRDGHEVFCASHADPEQAFRLALEKMEEQGR